LSLRLVAAGGDRSFDLPRGRSYTLGRSAQCDLPVRDPTVSRRHAELAPDGTALRVRDLGSTNGTFLNGKRVEEGIARAGDTLAFGKLGFALEELPVEPADTGEELLDATILRQVPVRAPGEPLAPGSGTLGGLGTVTSSVLRRAGSDAERQALQLSLLLDIAQTLSRQPELDRLLEKVADLAFEVMSADRVGILTGAPGEALVPRIWRTRGAEMPAPASVPRAVESGK
jgi:pSer/pThr/pTyr-binding forkhead associated (FHA) protein